MNPAQLLAHFEKIADASDAITRLRCFILDLAVRGKLVPQDYEDESASELLRKIAATKAKLGLRDAISAHLEAGKPFALPVGWAWASVGEVCSKTGSGSTPRGGREVYKKTGIPFLRSQNVYDAGLRMNDVVYLGTDTHSRMAATAVKAGDLLLNITGGSIGRCCCIADDFAEANVSQHVAILRPAVKGMQSFLHALIRSPYFQSFVIGEQTGAGRGGLPKNRMDRIVVALPPLAEQHRIVARVDELMALCDQLEAARAERESRRDRLAASSLARLNTPSADSFQQDARFALDVLPALTTRPDQVKQLRQTILNLAVRGKLVPQDPNDEPIHVKLKKASARRAALVHAKQVRQKKLDGYGDLVVSKELPASWAVERLGNLVDPENTISYGVLVPGEEVADGIPFVRAQDLTLSDHPLRPNKTISPEIEKAYSRTRLRGGEILVCVVGSIGKLGVVPPSWAGANIARAVARIAPIPEISREYLLVVIRGEPVQRYFTETTRTLAQPTLNVGLIEQTPIPLPPLAEQQRIVAKVDELMGFCDRIEASLTAIDERRSSLLKAILGEALQPAEVRDEAA